LSGWVNSRLLIEEAVCSPSTELAAQSRKALASSGSQHTCDDQLRQVSVATKAGENLRSHENLQVASFFRLKTLLDKFIDLRTGLGHSMEGEDRENFFQHDDGVVYVHELPCFDTIQEALRL
jgi:hypothetical protein